MAATGSGRPWEWRTLGETNPVSYMYIGKSAGSCASVIMWSLWTAVRFPMAADLRDLDLGLSRSFARRP